MVDQFDLLVEAVGGTVSLPREVLDPEEDEDLPGPLLSEIGRSQRHFLRRGDSEGFEIGHRLRALRARDDIEVLDLTGDELQRKQQLTSRALASEHGLVQKLGAGEASVMAAAEARGCSAAMDDAAARRVLGHIAPQVGIVTSRELLVSVTDGSLSSAEAQIVYDDMLAAGYRGPPQLFSA